MLAQLSTYTRIQPVAAAAIVIAIAGVATIFGFLYFQYVLLYQPCPLCLEQRIAFYVAVPLAVMVLLGLSVGASRKVMTLALGAIAVAMLWNAGLGVYHSGIEWGWWPGPPDCSGPMTNFGPAGSILDRIQREHIPRCDQAAWRFLGVSLAGYNVLISLTLAIIAASGAGAAWKSRPREIE